MAALVPRVTPPQGEEPVCKKQQGFFQRHFGNPGSDETYATVNENEVELNPSQAEMRFADQAIWVILVAVVLIFVLFLISL